MGGPENGNFPLLYVVKMSLRRWVVQKSLKTPLRNIKMGCPLPNWNLEGFTRAACQMIAQLNHGLRTLNEAFFHRNPKLYHAWVDNSDR